MSDKKEKTETLGTQEENALLEIGESFLKGFKEGYFNAVETKYSSLEDDISDIFPLKKLNNYLNFNLIILNPDLFSYNYQIVILDNSTNEIIDKSKNDEMKGKTEFINPIGQYDDTAYINSLYPNNKKRFFEIFILHGVDRTLLNLNQGNLESRIQRVYQFGLNKGKDYAGYHFVHYNQEMNTPVNKQESKPSIFNIHRVDDMISAVNDENFEYQMKEAIAVFENQHYLPAAATFCVALETLLIIFKQRNGLKHRPSDSSIIKDLVDELSSKQKITYRENKRLEISYELRNTINHSNIGMVAREDCLFIINAMRTFIDDHRNVFNQSK